MRFRPQLVAALTALAITAVARPVLAAERVMLANGFDMRCNHHAQVGPMVRLYTGTGKPATSNSALTKSPATKPFPILRHLQPHPPRSHPQSNQS